MVLLAVVDFSGQELHFLSSLLALVVEDLDVALGLLVFGLGLLQFVFPVVDFLRAHLHLMLEVLPVFLQSGVFSFLVLAFSSLCL